MTKKLFFKFLKALKNPKAIWPYIYFHIGKIMVRRIKKDGQMFYKYKGVLYPEYLKQKNAAPNIFETARKYCRGRGIDIGAGECPFPDSIPVENEEHQNAFKLDNFEDNSMDYIFSSHCLEHLKEWERALALWIRKIKQGGILFLYLPHESVPMWRPGGFWVLDNHKWSPNYKIINKFLLDNGMKILEYNSGKDKYWSFHIVAEKEQ